MALATLNSHQLVVKFDDGRVVIVDFTRLTALGGVFERLSDPKFFRRARIADEGRAVAWPGRLDFCADAFYLEQTKRRRVRPQTTEFDALVFDLSTEVVAA